MSEPKYPPFNPLSTELSFDNARFLAHVSSAAYRSDQNEIAALLERAQIRGWNCSVEEKNTCNATGLCLSCDEAIVIAYRGTQEPEDFIINASCDMGGFSYGRVHKGFRTQFRALKAWMVEMLNQKPLSRPIWLTGHSLGGALAAMCAAFLQKTEPRLARRFQGIYTFGQPRTGDRLFARQYNERMVGKSFRFVNNRDIVAKIPVPLLSLDYDHVQAPVFFDNEGKVHFHDKVLAGVLTRLMARVRMFARRKHPLTAILGTPLFEQGIKDHALQNYIAIITKLCLEKSRHVSLDGQFFSTAEDARLAYDALVPK